MDLVCNVVDGVARFVGDILYVVAVVAVASLLISLVVIPLLIL